MIVQLNPTIPLLTPKGKGYAIAMIDYSQEHDLFFVVAQDSGEIWTWNNKDVRMHSNITMGRDPGYQSVDAYISAKGAM